LNTLANKIPTWKTCLTWGVVLFVFYALLTVVAPGRGAAWSQDDGLFLLMSWHAANGFGLDRMLPQAPQYLFHALLMKAGLQEYLHFRYINYLMILLSSLVFFLGIDRRGFKSPVAPFAVCACMLVSPDSIQNPNSLAMAFFLFGAGCYFFSIHTTQLIKHLLLALSGVLLAVAGLMHAAVVIAMLVLIGVIWFFDQNIRRSFLLPGFLLASILLWASYISSLGTENFFATPAGHDSSAGHLVHNAWSIVVYYLKPFLLFLLTAWLLRKQKGEKFVLAQSTLSSVATLLCIASLITFLTGSTHRFPGWLTVSQIPGAVFFLLLFTLSRWLCERSTFSDGAQAPAGSSKVMQFHRILSDLRSDALRRKQIIGVSGLILIQAAVATGSASSIIHGMMFFAGPALGLTIVLWDSLNHRGTSSPRVLITLTTCWLGILSTIAFTYNHPTNQPVISRGRVVLTDAPLRGILEQPRYAASVKQLGDAYKTNKCENMTLLTLDYIPMVYYILQHPAPNSLGAIRPIMYFPEEHIQSSLDPRHGWCVIDATGIETQADIEHNHGIDKRATIRSWLEQQSDRIITIPSPSPDIIGNIRFIVRDARLTLN
jgi:hypothetical protein